MANPVRSTPWILSSFRRFAADGALLWSIVVRMLSQYLLDRGYAMAEFSYSPTTRDVAEMTTEVPIYAKSRPWYKPRAWWIIPAVIVIGGAAAAALVFSQPTKAVTTNHPSGTTTQTTVPDAVGTGYLAQPSDGVVFIQWTESGNRLSGTAQYETLSGSPPNQTVSTQTISVTGQLSGSTITVSFDGGASVFGTLSGGSFTVNFPQNDGSLEPITFQEASATQFNEALASLQGNTSSTDRSAAAAEAATAAQAAAATQAAEAATAAKVAAATQAAQPICQGVGGTLSVSPDGSAASCANIPYIGSDGSTYYGNATMNPTSGQFAAPLETAGIGATQQECATAYYPDLSTGPGYGTQGVWNGLLQACVPSS